MEVFFIIVYLIVIVWGVLNIVLFFKIWGMTNDVSAIKEYLAKTKLNTNVVVTSQNNQNNVVENKDVETQVAPKVTLKKGDRVRHTTYYTDRVMIIGEIHSDGSCMCLDEKGEPFGTFSIEKLVKI